MRRQIIKIDEDKCNGCGLCVPNCPEGALKVIDGKARLVGELLCDGLGACIGNCPEGAITIEEREAEKYDEKKVMGNIITAGPGVIKAHLKHLRDHGQKEYFDQALDFLKNKGIEVPDIDDGASQGAVPPAAGCPGMRQMDLGGGKAEEAGPGTTQVSELRQWPLQLHLLSPDAPYFKGADIVVAADCVPFAFADFHKRFLRGKILIIFCPKLDRELDIYIEKLSQIIKKNGIRSITIVHMEVPCCYGTVSIVEEALKRSGQNVLIKDYTVSIRGEIV